MESKIIMLFQWEVHDFKWGTAVKERRSGKWHNIFLKPNGQRLNIEHLNVVLHKNGIEFLS